MSNDNGKISVRQAMIIIVLLFCTPAIRYIPIFTTQQAKHAAWIAPFVAIAFEIIYILIWSKLIKKYEGISYIDIMKDVVGKIFGNILVIMYFIWITFLLSYNVRMYCERILSSAMPNVSIFLILGAMLVVVGYVVKNGIVTIAKMCEIFFIFLGILFIVYNTLIIPSLNVGHLFPVTYEDTWPTMMATFGIIAIFSYNILVFVFNDKITNNGQFKKIGLYTIVALTLISLAVIIVPLGVLGWPLLVKLPLPYLNSLMQISLFDIIERVEAGLIIFWIIADFTLITIFVYSAVHIIKLSFKISNIQPVKVLYIVGIFFLALILAKSTLELKILSENFITWFNIIMGYCIPILIFIIAKIRKKV